MAETNHLPWKRALEESETLRFATIIDPKYINRFLSTDEGLSECIDWCRSMAVTRVYLENSRMWHKADMEVLKAARDRFISEGFQVAGGVTPNGLGKTSTGWIMCSCFSDDSTRQELHRAFEQAASLFDLIMIDDFFFTDCECDVCRSEKGTRDWAAFRTDLMLEMAEKHVTGAAKSVNPDCKIILKFPQWLDILHHRGYDTVRQIPLFDFVYMGTEARDREHEDDLPYTVVWQSWFLMRWLKERETDKCLGGWFDAIATSPATYIEQAVQTILADPGEVTLFSLSNLRIREARGEGQCEAFREILPSLFDLARFIKGCRPRGLVAVQPEKPDAGGEVAFMPFMGELGIPLVPSNKLAKDDIGAVMTVHGANDSETRASAMAIADDGKPLILTPGAAACMGLENDPRSNVCVIPMKSDPFSIIDIPAQSLKAIRQLVFDSLGMRLNAPADMGIYLLGDDLMALSNFSDTHADIEFECHGIFSYEHLLSIPTKADMRSDENNMLEMTIPPRTTTLLRMRQTA